MLSVDVIADAAVTVKI